MTDTQELIYTITAVVIMIVLLVALIIWVFKYGAKREQLEKKKTELQIKYLNLKIRYYNEVLDDTVEDDAVEDDDEQTGEITK